VRVLDDGRIGVQSGAARRKVRPQDHAAAVVGRGAWRGDGRHPVTSGDTAAIPWASALCQPHHRNAAPSALIASQAVRKQFSTSRRAALGAEIADLQLDDVRSK